MIKLKVEDIKKAASSLKAGDEVLLTGRIYTARDAAHKKIFELLKSESKLPFLDLEGAVIYYAGPTPAKEGMAVGSCGPTTSSRMDVYAPELYDRGIFATIGKGDRSEEVKKSIIRNGGIYFCALGGAGALASKAIKKCEVIAFGELGCESVKALDVVDLPIFVGIDALGNSIFSEV